MIRCTICSWGFMSQFEEAHQKGKHAPSILTTPLPNQNLLSKIPVSDPPEPTAQ